MKSFALVLGAAACALGSTAYAQEDLAKKHNCFACHAVDKKVVGPAYKQVADKYRGDKAAALADSQEDEGLGGRYRRNR